MKQRYYSLDVFRGATVALMILVNNPGSWSHIYAPLDHAPWHGLTPTDLVFPFFLFAVGNAMAFVMPGLQALGDGVFWRKVLKRTFLIFFIGLFLNWWPFVTEANRLATDTLELHKATIFKGFTWVDISKNSSGSLVETIKGIRIFGVLQRIALCYFFAAIIVYYFKPRKAFFIGLVLLLAYWGLCLVGNPSDPFSLKGWFGTEIDKSILGSIHLYKGEGIPFDPEGIMSSMAAIVQVIFGYMVGHYIIQKGKNFEMISALFVLGCVLIATGFCWDMVLPINKKIWTSSYTVYTSGLATLCLATLIYMIEMKNLRGWLSSFFNVFGKNALFVFALSAFLPRGLALIKISNGVNAKGEAIYTNPWSWLYQKVLVHVPGDPKIGSLLYALCVIGFMWAICYWMDKRKIYVKV